jgi:hypothetical protein
MIGYDATIGVSIFAALNLALTYVALFVFRLRVWHLIGLQLVGVVITILLIRAAAPGFSQRIGQALGKEKETGEFQQDLRVAGFVLTAMFGLQGLMIHMTRGLTGAALILPAVDFVLTLLGV